MKYSELKSEFDIPTRMNTPPLLGAHRVYGARLPVGYGCKGECWRHYPERLNTPIYPMAYKMGYRRCSACEFYVKTTDNFCKCCGKKFRFKPLHNNKRGGKFEGY